MEPERVYCMPGLTFSPQDLFEEFRHFKPDFEYSYGNNEPNVRFALRPRAYTRPRPVHSIR